MALQVASLFGVLNLRDNMTPGLNSALGNARSFGSTIQTMGGSLRNFGASMTAFMAPAGAGLAASINQSREFSRSMSNINSILGITGNEAASLRSELLAYGGSTVAGPQAVADAYYNIVSGVADASTHMAILQAATATSEAGQADLNATTSALIATMNSFRFGAEDAAYVSDIFTRTVQTGVLTMDELASAFPMVTGLANNMGIGIQDLASQMSFLTTQGFSASESATFLKSMMTSLLNPTTALQENINALGYSSGQAMVDALGLVGAYEAIRQQGGGAFDGIITSQEALQGALALTGEGAHQFMTNFAADVDGATESARAIQNETAGWQLFTSQLQALAITTGDTLAPVLLDLLNNHITPLVTKVTDWITENPKLATTIAGIVGALVIAGPVIALVGTILSGVGTVIGVVTGLIGFLTPIVAGASAAFVAGGGGISGMGAAIYAILGPIGILVGAITLLVGWMTTQEGGVIGVFNRAVDSARMLGDMLKIVLAGSIMWVVTKAMELWGWIQKLISGFSSVINSIGSFATSTGNVLNSVNPFAEEATQGTRTIAGARAGGGGVTVGRQYLVGERGPELYTPSQSGTISSNRDTAAALAGGGGDTINIYGNIITPDPEDFMRQLEERRRRRQ